MISEGSCDSEDRRNNAENSALVTAINYILKYIQIENIYFKSYHISHYYCYYCILDEKYAALVSRRSRLSIVWSPSWERRRGSASGLDDGCVLCYQAVFLQAEERPCWGLEIVDVLQQQIEPWGPSAGNVFLFIFSASTRGGGGNSVYYSFTRDHTLFPKNAHFSYSASISCALRQIFSQIRHALK